MISFSFSSLSKRPGATVAGVFSLALSSVLLLCGAGSVPIENLLPQGAMQGDLDAGGYNLTNAATVSATNVVVSGSLTAPVSFTLPFSQITGLAASATTDTTSASNIISGTLAAARVATLNQDTTGSAGSVPFSGITGITGTADASHVLSGAGTYILAGSPITLGTNITAVGFSLTGGTLDLANLNNAGGLAQFASDNSIAWLGTTDAGQDSIAIGVNAHAVQSGVAIGEGSGAPSSGGVAIGIGTVTSSAGAAMGSTAAATTGGAVGSSALESGGGFAGGNNTGSVGGGANFAGGYYVEAGLAIGADEVAVPNGSGYATLTGLVPSTAPATSSSTGIAGQFAYDGAYFYVCTAANTWVRTPLSSW